jgi:hypothetical protein
VIPATFRVAVFALVYVAPRGIPLVTAAQTPPLLYSHWNVGEVPLTVTVNEAFPVVAHVLLLNGSLAILTGIQVEVTVTVTVNVDPTHVPEVGVTV